MYKIPPEFLWLEFQSWRSIVSFFLTKMGDSVTPWQYKWGPQYFLSCIACCSVASRTNFTFTLKRYKNDETLQSMIKSGLRCHLKLISTFYTGIQDFLQTIVYAQRAHSRFQQGHTLVHFPTTSHLSQWKYSSMYSPSVQKTQRAAVTSATSTAASLLKTKSHRKCWNLITHWETFSFPVFNTELGDASILHRSKFGWFIHYCPCELETHLVFLLRWSERGPVREWQQKAPVLTTEPFHNLSEKVYQPLTIHRSYAPRKALETGTATDKCQCLPHYLQ